MKYYVQSEIRSGNIKTLDETLKMLLPDIIIPITFQKTILKICFVSIQCS